MSEYRPRNNLQSSRAAPVVVMGVVAAFALLALGAAASSRGEEPGSAAPAPGPTAATPAAPAVAEREAEGADENDEPGAGADSVDEDEGGGEAEATMKIPSFDAISPMPAASDYLARARTEGERLVVDLPAGKRTLTIDGSLQQRVTALLRSYQTPYGAVAAIDPKTGRVLALAEYSHDAPSVRGLPLRALYPAASVFKIVTGTALLTAGVTSDESVCYHGGKRRLNEKLLVDDSRRDRRCATLTEAMGHSTNVVFAKLARRKLDAATLRRWAERYGFNSPPPFPMPTDASIARIPEDGFGLATTAAGFGDVFMSPLQGALLAGTVANGGVQMSPVLFDGDESKPRKVVDAATAATLADMLETTVTEGTARRAFRERGRYVLGDARAAGKTGSLSDKKPFRDFSWFVGWAPKDDPKIAVAAVVVNGTVWRVRAPYVARETMRMFLEPRGGQKQAKVPKAGNRARRRVGSR